MFMVLLLAESSSTFNSDVKLSCSFCPRVDSENVGTSMSGGIVVVCRASETLWSIENDAISKNVGISLVGMVV